MWSVPSVTLALSHSRTFALSVRNGTRLAGYDAGPGSRLSLHRTDVPVRTLRMTPTDPDTPYGDPPFLSGPSEWDERAPAHAATGDRYREARRRTEYESRGVMSTGRWMWEGVKAVSTAIVLFL